MSKIAKLVLCSLMIRVIIEENATDSEIISASRDKFINVINTSLGDNIESIENDVECPYEEGEE